MTRFVDKPDFIQPAVNGPSAHLVASLSQAIHEHRLLPGTKLGEDELSEIYNVSRTVVRSALQALSHVELVELKRNRGAFVSQPTVREAREVFEARALLEPRTAHSAAERMTPEDVARLEAHIAAEHEALAEGEVGKALRLSGHFHIEISRIADQSTIAGFIERLVARSSLIIALYWKRQRALCEKHAHHALVDAFRRGDGQDAEELMKSHLLDIVSGLDLSETPKPTGSLKEILKG
ncbi:MULTISPECIES: GntR family transcriptional regulator [Rhodobacterales]|jgi:DNA-binding GntR family transcriptional regulator|uniref:GntR family transcriptional regulator n=1 Tax=Phaeobacter gallaeciensis TaxID=60890 RepID=A0ABD4XCL0_9RHOB|nr:GntR family transcriptional regulator [Phaeobacter gallaeciensis]MDF1772123.1 GntR family transcriptional regulator [Pseudophaeobacter sp. bin_em_oilr2.035]MEC9311835.1 GntR family transcriptional regulator [Pseudomonadota bacterium]MDE4139939.1 GntR family transcriptional regulator [Phaeobacter gallaeciensis]MDE4145807.1 GntR family transcriptional regulator [Phaeobacter gallaeciensis]MDE4148451.1 GntR family transcriptional regulator [Phaeobacter gallaeciensis]